MEVIYMNPTKLARKKDLNIRHNKIPNKWLDNIMKLGNNGKQMGG
jgi:hypothetical protein